MELNQTSIHYYDKRLARISTCSETADSIVPDTFPDIGRIVCAYGTAAVRDQTPQSGRLLASGMVQVVVLYEPEKGDGLRRLSVPVSFAHIEECDGIDAETVCMVRCQVAAVDVVAVNSRKLNVKVQLCFFIEGYCQTQCEITEGTQEKHVELLSETQTVTLTEQVRTYPITVLDDVSMQDAEGLSILHANCTLRSSECRAMRGKIVLKGEAEVQCLAMQEDDAVRVLSNTTPFTQILEMPEVEEQDVVCAQLAVREIDSRIEPDGLLSYTVSVTALITVRRTKTLCRIKDLYLPGQTLQMSEEKTTLHSMPPSVSFTAEASETLQTAQHVAHIISAEAICCSAKHSAKGDLQITAAIQVLYLSDEQQLYAVSRLVPLTMPCLVAGELSDISLTVRVSAAGETGVMCNVTAAGMATAEERVAFRHITSLEEGEAQQKAADATLLLRYIQEEQQLWEIAKDCGTTMEEIRRVNDLPADATGVSHMVLLIPMQV